MKQTTNRQELAAALLVACWIHCLLFIMLGLTKPQNSISLPGHAVLPITEFVCRPSSKMSVMQRPQRSKAAALPQPMTIAQQIPAQPQPKPQDEHLTAHFVQTKTAENATQEATGDRPIAAGSPRATPAQTTTPVAAAPSVPMPTAAAIQTTPTSVPAATKIAAATGTPEKISTSQPEPAAAQAEDEPRAPETHRWPTAVLTRSDRLPVRVQTVSAEQKKSTPPEQHKQEQRAAQTENAAPHVPAARAISLAALTQQVVARAQAHQPTTYEHRERGQTCGTSGMVDGFAIPGAGIDPYQLDPVTLSKMLYAQRIFCILEQTARYYNELHNSVVYAQYDEEQRTIFNLTVDERGTVVKAWFTPPLHVSDLEHELLNIVHEAGLLPPLPKTCQAPILTIQYPILVASSRGFNKYYLRVGPHH